MKICLAANTAWNLAHFRRNHLITLLDMGVEVHAVAPEDDYVDDLVAMGVEYHPWKIERASLNPSKEAISVRRIQKIYKSIKPDLVHHYTVKALLYGTTAARFCGVKGIVNSVTGLPYIIVSPSKGVAKRAAQWFAMKWYSWCVHGRNTHVIVQNRDDLEMLESFAPKVAKANTITNGSGVALDYFPYTAPPANERPHVVFVGRFLREKGIFELMEAVRQLRNGGLDFRLSLCGSIDSGNLSSATESHCQQWKDEGLVDHIGRVNDVRPFLQDADIVVLPSYREGTPRSLLEAMSTGRPIITTDVPGCRNVVEDGVNGHMIAVRDASAIANAMADLINNKSRREEMGEESRRKAVTEFDEKVVIRQTLQVYQQLCPNLMPPTDQWNTHSPSVKQDSIAGDAVPAAS